MEIYSFKSPEETVFVSEASSSKCLVINCPLLGLAVLVNRAPSADKNWRWLSPPSQQGVGCWWAGVGSWP